MIQELLAGCVAGFAGGLILKELISGINDTSIQDVADEVSRRLDEAGSVVADVAVSVVTPLHQDAEDRFLGDMVAGPGEDLRRDGPRTGGSPVRDTPQLDTPADYIDWTWWIDQTFGFGV